MLPDMTISFSIEPYRLDIMRQYETTPLLEQYHDPANFQPRNGRRSDP